MALIFWLILSLFLRSSSCQIYCPKEILDDNRFSINVTEHETVQFGECVRIPFSYSIPINKVTIPYEEIWFEEDPQSNVSVNVVHSLVSEATGVFIRDGLPHGEYEYGFKLEWGCNQTYIFPNKVRISVSESSPKPTIHVPPLKEGQLAEVRCFAARLCSRIRNIHWKSTIPDRHLSLRDGRWYGERYDGRYDDWYDERYDRWRPRFRYGHSQIRLVPTAEDHNSNITCVVEYGHDVVETTVTLSVKYAPRILNGSWCQVEGKLLVCVCIAEGNPLPSDHLAFGILTDYSVTSAGGVKTVKSTFTMPIAEYHNSTVKCISSNEVGRAEMEIPLQNYNDDDSADRRQKPDRIPVWITAVSLSVNLILLAGLIAYTYKRYKSTQKKPGEETDTYASLNMAEVGQEYSVITPRLR